MIRALCTEEVIMEWLVLREVLGLIVALLVSVLSGILSYVFFVRTQVARTEGRVLHALSLGTGSVVMIIPAAEALIVSWMLLWDLVNKALS